MAYDKVIDSTLLDAGLTATANAIRAKTGDSSPIAWDSANGFKAAVEGIDTEGGVELPELGDTAAQPTDMAADKVLYDDQGNPVTGTLIEANEIQEKIFATSDYSFGGTPGDTVFNVSGMYNGSRDLPDGLIVRPGAGLGVRNAPTNFFGDATPSQVAKGAKFTSSSGLLMEGNIVDVDDYQSDAAWNNLSQGDPYTIYDSDDESYLLYTDCSLKNDTIFRKNVVIPICSANSNQLGEARPEDVRSGVTFTSGKAGLKVTGIMEVGSGSGVTLPTLNPPGSEDDLLEGVQLIGQDGSIVDGKIPKKTASDITVDGPMMTVPAGYYETQSLHSVDMVSLASPSISVDNTGKITASVTQTEGYVSDGTKSATKQLTTQAEQTIIPGTFDKTIASGRYLTGTQTIKGDSNLKSANIKKGVSIFDVPGSLDVSSGGSSGDSTGSDIAGISKFTLAEDATVAGTFVKLGNVPWIAEHINDANLYVNLFSLNTSLKTDSSVFNAVSSNKKCINGSYSGAMYRSQYLSFVSFSSQPFNNTTNTGSVRLCGDGNGDVYIAAYSDQFFAAGEYALLYGLI